MSGSIKCNRWLKVAVGAMMMLSLGTMYAWSIFRAPFSALYPGWSISDLSLNFTICMVFYCLGGFVGGKLSGATSNRVSALVAAGLLFVAFFGVSLLPAEEETAKWLLYIFYGVLSGLGTGVAYNAVVSGVSAWFPDRTGLATGVLLTGFGLGSMAMGQLADRLIAAVGLFSTFRIFAVGVALVLALGSAFIRLPGPDVTLPPPPDPALIGEIRDYTPHEMLRRPNFWLFFLWNVCMSASSLMVVNSAATISAYYGAAAILGLVVSVVNGLSRLPFGMCIDLLGREKTMALANGGLVLTGLVLTIGGMSRSPVLIIIGLMLVGVCFGNSVTVNTLVIRQFYGNRYYAVNLSIISCCAIPGAFIGPMISSALQEAAGGDYTTTFLAILAFGLLVCLLGRFIKKP